MVDPIWINRAPVLTLWAAVAAEQLGFDLDEALSPGRAVSVTFRFRDVTGRA